MFTNEPVRATQGIFPASQLLPGLGKQFDLLTNTEYIDRYHAIQSAADSPEQAMGAMSVYFMTLHC
jgi:hypothetical protein